MRDDWGRIILGIPKNRGIRHETRVHQRLIARA
jgi:hypothetical protein